VGASALGGGRRLRLLPIALALVAAGTAGFLFAQWASRPTAALPGAAPPPPSLAPPSAPPATYAAPYVPAAPPAQTAAPASEPAAPRRPVPAPIAAAETAAATAGTQAVETTFQLQAVTQQDGQPVAIVNGQLVHVGDMVEGARVLRIDADSVEVEKDGRRFVIGF